MGKGQKSETRKEDGENKARNKVTEKTGRVKGEGSREKQKQMRREKTEVVVGRDKSQDGV